MLSKEDLDIILAVDHLDHALQLEKHGFTFKGEINIPLRYFFSKNTDRSKINLHVCEKGHGFIDLNLAIRNFLRAHPDQADAYAKVKEEALKRPNAHEKIRPHLSRYTDYKNAFIKSIISLSGFEGRYVNFCMHQNEWAEYHRIKNEQIFKPCHVEYDKSHPSFQSENHFHFCLYQGAKVIGFAHIERLSSKKAALRPIAIDTPYQNKGHGRHLLSILEKWLINQGIEILHLHARIDALTFYEKQGYEYMPFPEPDSGLPSESKDMAKMLTR